MNTAILVCSFQFQTKFFNLTVSLAIWLNELLTKAKANNHKFYKSLRREDYEVSEVLVIFTDDKMQWFPQKTIAKQTYLLRQMLTKSNIYDHAMIMIMEEACIHEYNDAARLLLEFGYKCSCADSYNLINATRKQNKELVQLLLENGVQSIKALRIASKNKNAEILVMLLDYVKVYNDITLCEVMINATKNNLLSAVKFLINKYIPTSSYSENSDVEEGHIVRLTIPSKCLNIACERSYFDIVTILLEHKISVDDYIFIRACKKDNIELLKLLFRFRSDFNIKNLVPKSPEMISFLNTIAK